MSMGEYSMKLEFDPDKKRLKLRESVKTKWIQALRSGKYKQGTGRLRDVDKDIFCCLGVLYDIVGRGRSCTSWKKDGETAGKSYASLWGGDVPKAIYACLQQPVTLIHLDEWGRRVIDRATFPQAVLAQLNDTQYWRFEKIATWIEKNL